MFIKKILSGSVNEKCFLRSRKGCSKDISGEHYISKNLLEVISANNKNVDISGLSWIPKEKLKSIGKNSLVSKILCTKHNSDLSELDSTIGKFVSYISKIDKNFTDNTTETLQYTIDGRAIEQWIIKTIIGLIEAKSIYQKKWHSLHI